MTSPCESGWAVSWGSMQLLVFIAATIMVIVGAVGVSCCATTRCTRRSASC